MAFPTIRARIAPIALFVAFAFVVAGFFRADREMSNAETDRASVMVSEAATLVQLFVLERVAQLNSVERTASSLLERGNAEPDSIVAAWAKDPRTLSYFDHIALIDSTSTVTASIGQSVSLGARVSLPAGSVELNQSRSEPLIVISSENGARSILFIEALHSNRDLYVIGSIRADSLGAMLAKQSPVAGYEFVIRAGADTLLRVSTHHGGRLARGAVHDVVMPSRRSWTVEMRYAPSGRGVRIALWVVGLGAIVGLGIGLLLERREASRIADRSSELEHLSAELLRANRAKSEFLANVSHELRTPLNAIVGFVDLLRDGVYGTLNSRQVGPVERIEASANHLRHLVDQVLDLAKMAAGRLEVHTEPIELRPFVFDVASEVEPLITEKGLSFSLAVGATLPRVRTDPTHLRQILINLLGNAVKFTNNGGISIRGKLVGNEETPGIAQAVMNAATQLARTPRPDGLWIALQVADSGMGIPDKDRERIFDEFEQVNAGPRGDSMRRGTGLGLSISRRLARLIGGDITVESELGRGSIFTVWLPVDPADVRGDQAA